MRIHDIPVRIPVNRRPILSQELEKKLLTYVSLGAAASACVVAGAQPAEAKVIHTQANETINFQKHTKIDLNNDGIPDFAFGSDFQFCCETNVLLGPFKFNKIMSNGTPLGSGVTVGLGGKFISRPAYLEFAFENFSSGIITYGGQWLGVQDKFLGVAFRINGQVHFGWARLSFSGTALEQGTLVDYAYETVPGKAIVTGATSDDEAVETKPTSALQGSTPQTLGALAGGASGLHLWRK